MNNTFDLTQRVSEAAEELLGSTRDLRDVLDEDELENVELLQLLDEQVMLCECCGWWVEADEVNDDGHCMDCSGD